MKEFFHLVSRRIGLLTIVGCLVLIIIGVSTYSLVKVASAQTSRPQIPEVKDKTEILSTNPSPEASPTNLNKIKRILGVNKVTLPSPSPNSNSTVDSKGTSTAKGPRPTNNQSQVTSSASPEPSDKIEIDDDVEHHEDIAEVKNEKVEQSNEPAHQ